MPQLRRPRHGQQVHRQPPTEPDALQRTRDDPHIDGMLRREHPEELACRVAAPVPLPFTKGSLKSMRTCFTVEGLLAPNECLELIQLAECRGFETTSIGPVKLATGGVRRSGRCMVDCPGFVARLWERLRPTLGELRPSQSMRGEWEPVGLNERLRILRYTPGDYFRPHQDGAFVRARGPTVGEPAEASQLTLMLYLNEAGRGGETVFLNPQDKAGETRTSVVTPTAGLGLVFDHELMHEGAELLEGVKYALRTDVMFRKLPPVATVAPAAPLPGEA